MSCEEGTEERDTGEGRNEEEMKKERSHWMQKFEREGDEREEERREGTRKEVEGNCCLGHFGVYLQRLLLKSGGSIVQNTLYSLREYRVLKTELQVGIAEKVSKLKEKNSKIIAKK